MRQVARILLLIFFSFAVFYAQSQDRSSVKIGTQIPLQYHVNYEYLLNNNFSLQAGVGVVAKPYPDLLFSMVDKINNVNNGVLNLIKNSYKGGYTFQLGSAYNFGKNYFKVAVQYMNLSGSANMSDLAGFYLNQDLSFLNNFLKIQPKLDLKSNLYQANFLYGRKFTLPNGNEIHAELGVLKTFSNKNNFQSNTFIDRFSVVNTVYSQFDHDLKDFFVKKAVIPTINVYYVIKF